MERVGVASHLSSKQGSSVVKSDMFGEVTIFRQVCSAYVEKSVKGGKWFGFGKLASEEQLDVLSVQDNRNTKLGSMVSGYFPESAYRTAIYKYLLHDYMCYYEQPVVKKVNDLNGFGNSYNKYIITSNIGVAAEWLGIDVESAEKQYGSRLIGVEEDDGESFYPYLKLYETKTGERKITKPRTNLDLEAQGIRIVPMFALKVGVDVLYELAQEGTYNVHFIKDSGQKRCINTCFSQDIVSKLYSGNKSVAENWNQVYNGSFESNPTMERGYIRVFEVGSSVYNSPTRSINFARITAVEKAEPDMSFMYIDMDAVLDTFIHYIFSYKWRDSDEIEEFVSMLDAFEVGTKRVVNNVRMSTVTQIEAWAQSQNTLLSTVFIRQLALFMLANPQWFEGYDGSASKKEDEALPMESSQTTGGLPLESNEGFLPLNNDSPFEDGGLPLGLEDEDDFELPLG